MWKMTLFVYLGLLFIVVGVLGCNPTYKQGTLITDDQLLSLKKGVSTKQQIIDAYGGPQDIKMDGNRTILTYKYQEIKSFGGNVGRDVTFIFDGDILKDIMVSKGTSLPNPLTGK